MENSEDIQKYYQDYIEIYDTEVKRLKQFKDFINQTQSGKLFDRKNFIGHITVSAIIIDYNDLKILVLHHKSLDRWLQPGGHVDKTDNSILDATFREIYEETNIPQDHLTLVSPTFSKIRPFDIDSHPIPKNISKGEDRHHHHDFRYLFIYKGDRTVDFNNAESNGFKWIDFEELATQATFLSLVDKIWHLLSFEFRTNLFYGNIISKVDTKDINYISVVVSHIIPDSVCHLQAIDKIFPIKAIIPKPNSINENIHKKLTNKNFKILHVSRDNMPQNTNEIVQLLEKCNEKIILFDIGGYFAKIHEGWPPKLLKRIALVIEDTENGLQKYEKIREKNNYPFKVVSVARSPLKENEDFLVGQSVLFSADWFLRKCGKLIQYMKCSVFGYGKIGRSIAFHLMQRGVKPSIFDTDPLKRISAFNELGMIPTRESIINESDVIFSATGNHCLTLDDFRKLKNGCLIFSVTSSDDEMDLSFLEGEYEKDDLEEIEELKGYISRYYNKRNFFYLVNNGNAVNFIHDAVMGSFIHLVRSEMILAINSVEDYNIEEIGVVPTKVKREIAKTWLEIFDPENRKLTNIKNT